MAAAPDHPRTVQVREDLLQAETLRGLAAYALAPGREQRLAQLIPSTATAKKEQHDRQAAALHKRLKRIMTTQDNLMRELRGSFDMPDHAGEEYRRRIRADYATLDAAHQDITAQLAELAADPAPGNDLDLVTLLPEVAADLDELPADLQAELLAVFDIQIAWNAPMRQATIHATITDTTPGIVKALLARATDSHAPATSTAASDSAATSTDTSTLPGQGSVRIPIRLRMLPERERPGAGAPESAGHAGCRQVDQLRHPPRCGRLGHELRRVIDRRLAVDRTAVQEVAYLPLNVGVAEQAAVQRRDHDHARRELAGRQRETVRQRDDRQPPERVLVGLPAGLLGVCGAAPVDRADQFLGPGCAKRREAADKPDDRLQRVTRYRPAPVAVVRGVTDLARRDDRAEQDDRADRLAGVPGQHRVDAERALALPHQVHRPAGLGVQVLHLAAMRSPSTDSGRSLAAGPCGSGWPREFSPR